ncbi:MAG: peroxiredoxin [Solirubrobacterales bacterium]
MEFSSLPEGLPEPVDDGACDHLAGVIWPEVALPSSNGALETVDPALSVVYVFPMMGRPGVELPEGWDATPGARGCTVQSLAYAGVDFGGNVRAYGISSQPPDQLAEAAGRLGLPQVLLSDEGGELKDALALPEFELGGRRYLRRVTIGIRAGVIDRVWYPVFPPGSEVESVATWAR